MKQTKNYMKPKKVKPVGLTVDADELVQLLRIHIWKIIARNNAEELKDPLLKPLNKPMLYVQNAPKSDAENDDIANIKPTLDEVLPLPQKAEAKPAPKKSEQNADAKSEPKKAEVKPEVNPIKKKTSAKELVAKDTDELPGQMTMDDAIAEADGQKPQQQPQAQPQPQAQTETTQVQGDLKACASECGVEQQTNSVEEESPEEQKPTLRDRYLLWKIRRANRNDYYDKLEVQVANKNAACFEILDYLDKLQGED